MDDRGGEEDFFCYDRWPGPAEVDYLEVKNEQLAAQKRANNTLWGYPHSSHSSEYKAHTPEMQKYIDRQAQARVDWWRKLNKL